MSDLLCHVHVGMPKTGSSAIQSVFHQNPDPSILYAPFPNANHSTFFAVCFENRPEANRVNKLLGLSREQSLERRRSMRQRMSASLDKALVETNPKALLVSGERLSNAQKANEVAHTRFKDFFGQWANRYKIHGYARPLHSLLPSDFQQRIQTGHGTDIDLDWYYPNYRKKFEKFETVYGREAVTIRHFSRERLLGGDVLSDFATQIDADLGHLTAPDPNQSLSLEATAVVYVFAKSGRIQDTHQDAANKNKTLVSLLKRLPGTRMAFCPSAIATIAEKNAKDLEWIESRVGVSMYEDKPAKGTVIRSGNDLFEIAQDVSTKGLLKDINPMNDAPDPGVIAQWLRSDLSALTMSSA